MTVGIRTLGIALVLAIVITVLAYFGGRASHNAELEALRTLAENTPAMHEQITASKNKATSLEEAAGELAAENISLQEMISHLRSKPTEIEYITRVETVLTPVNPVLVYRELPESFIHMAGPLAVAEFSSHNDEYTFTTHELSFRSTLVTGQRDSAVLLEVASSRDHVWHEVPSTLQVQDTSRAYPWFGPTLHVGASLRQQGWRPSLVVAAPLIHVSESLDLLAPAVSVSEHPALEAYVLSYNVGKPLPVVDDIWLAAGVSVDTDLAPSVVAAITSQF